PAAIALECVAYFLIVPGVHGAALENGRLGKDGQQFRIAVAGEALRFDRGDDGGDREDPGRLGQPDHVVLECLPIDALHPKGHLRLLVNEDELAILWRQYFEFGVCHMSSPFGTDSLSDVPASSWRAPPPCCRAT